MPPLNDLDDLELPDGEEENEIPGQGESEAEDDPGEGTDSDDEESSEGHERAVFGKDASEENEGSASRVNSKGRFAERTRVLRNENRELSARLARQEAALEEFKQRQSQPREVDPEYERQKIALMSDEERMEYRFQQSEKRHQQELAAVRFQIADSSDRSNFEGTLSKNPRLERYRNEVEQLYQQELRAGRGTSRSVILNYVIGQGVISRLGQDGGKQKKQAQQRVQRQQTRPGDSRADVSSRGSKKTSKVDWDTLVI